jgi:hypothetical protein
MNVEYTKFRAKIVNNFVEVMIDYWRDDGDIDYSLDPVFCFDAFAKRITDKEVTILKSAYTLSQNKIDNEYFEEIDNNWPLPIEAFVKI